MSCLNTAFQWLLALSLIDIKNIVTIITLSIGAYVAYQGLKEWKAKLIGHQNYNLAKDLLILFYKYDDAIKHVRHPFMWTSEYPEFTDDELNNMTNEEKTFKETLYAYQARWSKISEIKPLLREKVLEAKAIWDDSISNIFVELNKIENELWRAINAYVSNKNPTSCDQKKVDDNVVFDYLQDSDEFRQKIQQEIQKIEVILKPLLKL